MAGEEILEKLRDANLLGRGGASFPVWQKWQMVRDEQAEKKFVVCNGSEGEPDVFKDGWLFEHRPDDVIDGMKIALETVGASHGVVYLNHEYYEKYQKRLRRAIGKAPIALFKKYGGYLAGEETTVIANIEGRRREPALKPPFPTQHGLYGYPTLINNVETFYAVAQIARGTYFGTRLYSINGDVKDPGVYEYSINLGIGEILKRTGNWPDFDFFVQVGGGASGEILLPEELHKPATGAASIHVYNRATTNPFELMERWIDFFMAENCDKCAPCREGAYRIAEMLKKQKLVKETLYDLFFVMEKTSFCPLGRSIPTPFRSLIEKVVVPALASK